MVTVSPSFSTPPRRISIVPEVPSPFDTSSREMSLSFENHQVEISLEDPRSIVSPGASSAPLTEDFTEVFPNLDINVTTPTKYPLMEELGVLNEMVDNMRVDLLQNSMLLTYIKDNFEKKWQLLWSNLIMNVLVYIIDRGDINQRLMVYCTDYITLLLVLCLKVYKFITFVCIHI